MRMKVAAVLFSLLVLSVQAARALDCNDDDACTQVDTCVEDECVGGSPVVCADDGDLCTLDYCDTETGECVHPTISCNDGNPCTSDSCNSSTGCEYTANLGASCNDGLECTSPDICRDKFPAIRPLPCTTEFQCDSLAGGGTCGSAGVCTCTGDGDCNSGFVCRYHACVQTCTVPGDCTIPPLNPVCADNGGTNVCHFTLTTLDTAVCLGDPAAAGTTCTDIFGECTTNDRCQIYQVDLGMILAGEDSSLDVNFPLCRGDNEPAATPCGVENPCYPGTCQLYEDPDISSEQVSLCIPNPVICPQDTDLCDIEYCNPANGECTHYTPPCGGECETEVCDPNSGCIPKENGTGCSDDNVCTENEQCLDGECVGQPAGDETPTITPTITPTSTPSNTPTDQPTNTPTSTPTITPTATPTNTNTEGPSPTPSNTPTATPSRTPSSTPSVTPTQTPTSTPTLTPTVTATLPPAATRTRQPIPVISSPTSGTGLLLIGLLAAGMLIALARRSWVTGG